MILSITIQKTKKQKAVKANLPHRWLHSKTHTLFIFTPDVQGQELIHLPLKPSHMKKRNIWLWADKRFQRRSEKKKKTLTSVRLIFHLISHLRERDSIQQSKCSLWKVGWNLPLHFFFYQKSIYPLFKQYFLYIALI